MKRLNLTVFLLGMLIIVIPSLAIGQEKELQQITVTAPRAVQEVVLTPSTTTINVGKYKIPGTPQNIVDILKTRPTIDFRGRSDLVPEYDQIYMRGFDPMRFSIAIDGMTIQRPGIFGTTQVHFGTLPLWRIEDIEIIPGPHSVLYWGKSEGGTINLKTKRPRKFMTLKPDIKVETGYRSYDTQTHSFTIDGGLQSFVYDFGFQHYETDGYLRNNSSDIDNYDCRLAYILPAHGYVGLDVAFMDETQETPVRNNPGDVYYDPGYPDTPKGYWGYWPWQTPERDRKEYSYRLRWEQPTLIGTWTLATYYERQDWDRTWLGPIAGWYGPEIKPPTARENHYWHQGRQVGGKIQDEITLGKHTLTFGFDTVQMWRSSPRSELYSQYGYHKPSHKRADLKAGYVQDKWDITSWLTFTGGLRYEYVDLWFYNWDYRHNKPWITGEDYPFIKKHRNQLVPKSFLTCKLGEFSPYLRDTSLSVGVSKIWNPIPSCMPCPRDIPHGAWVKPEHGVAFDFILMRRLYKDINMKVDYHFYNIYDYVAYNSKFAKYTPSPRHHVPPGLELSDYKINLHEIRNQGVDIELNGHIFDNLGFYIGYSFLELRNMGSEPAGEEAVSERAKHRVNAGLRFQPFSNTLLMLDYRFQDKQVAHVYQEVPPGSGNLMTYDVPMDSYHVFDFSVEQTLFKKHRYIKDAKLKFYIKNIFDEHYENQLGFPMTDRTFGGSISFKF